MSNWSMRKNYHGGCEIEFEGNRYVVEDVELKQIEKEHIDEAVYCDELTSCSLDWFYASIGSELVPDYFSSVDEELIQKATILLGYESEKDIAIGVANVIEDDVQGEDKFISSLILAKEIANRMNGKAILWYD